MSRPIKCITVDAAKEMQANWVSTRALDIERAMGQVDTREFLYSVEELQEYLDYVKKKSAEQGIANPGIRIYFAAYDNDTTDKATIFLAPTSGNSASPNNNYNIDPYNCTQGGYPPYGY